MIETSSRPPLSAESIAEIINRSWSDWYVSQKRESYPRQHVWASSWRACLRRMVLDMTDPDKLPAWPPDMLAKFRRGNDRERDIVSDLMRIGRNADPPFQVIGQQERVEIKNAKGRVVLTGKIDGKIEFDGYRQQPRFEIKTWSPFLTDKIWSFDDVFQNQWTRPGGYQLLSYLYSHSEPFGFLVLDRPGIPRLLPVELEHHLDRVEDFISKAERACDHVDAGTLPEYHDDADECRRCPFYGSVCNPPLTSGAGAQLLIDDELEALLARHAELEAAGKEYNGLDRDIKARFKGAEGLTIVGRFAVTGEWKKWSVLDMPESVRKQYTRQDPHGRFFVTIERPGQSGPNADGD